MAANCKSFTSLSYPTPLYPPSVGYFYYRNINLEYSDSLYFQNEYIQWYSFLGEVYHQNTNFDRNIVKRKKTRRPAQSSWKVSKETSKLFFIAFVIYGKGTLSFYHLTYKSVWIIHVIYIDFSVFRINLFRKN